MKNAKHSFFIALVVMFATSCNEKRELVFYGETITVAYPERRDTVSGYSVVLEDVYTEAMLAYDGILLFESYRHPDGILYLYDAETGKRINAICQRGEGPEEFTSCYSGNFEKISDGIHIWVSDAYRKSILLLNMQGERVRKINTSAFNKGFVNGGVGWFAVLNDSLLLTYVQSENIFDNKASAPYECIFNYVTGEIVREYRNYSDIWISEKADISPFTYLSSSAIIKPDKSKLASEMDYLKRVEIMDLESGKVKSIKTEDAPDLNVALSGERIEAHYLTLAADDHFIYVMECDNYRFSGQINVFDWYGNFLRILYLKEKDVEGFALDPIRRILYTKTNADEIMAYDLNFLYK